MAYPKTTSFNLPLEELSDPCSLIRTQLEEQLNQDAKPLFGSMHTAMEKTTLGERFAHVGIPDFEYARTDLQAFYEHMGSLPIIQEDGMMPAWWDEVQPTPV